MRAFWTTGLVRGLLVLVMTSFLAACGMTKSKITAEKSVDTFHRQYNENKFSEIFAYASSKFRASGKEADYLNFIQTIRNKLGAFKSGTVNSWRVNDTTSGTFVALRYDSQFEQGAGTEDFAFEINGGTANLLTFRVNSPLVNPK